MGRSFTPQGGAGTPFEGQEILSAFVCTPLQASTNDYTVNLRAFVNASVLMVGATAAINLTGLQGATPNRELTLLNISANPIVLKNASGLSLAANRFQFGADITLAQNQAVKLLGLAAGGWASQGGGGGGGGAPSTETFITVTDETVTLPNSAVLTAGTGITLTPAAGSLTIDAAVTPAGATTEVQYNLGDVLTADANLTWDPAAQTLTVLPKAAGAAGLVIGGGSIAGKVFGTIEGSSGALQWGVDNSGANLAFIDIIAPATGLDIRLHGAEMLELFALPTTGASTATFVATNKPGTDSGITNWLRVAFNGAVYDIPMFGE